MDAISDDFWDVLLWSFWLFIWISAVMIWIRCLFDLFGDRTLNGWGKAGWAVLLTFVPWFGAFIYLIVRGRSMAQRQATASEQQRAEQEKYIQRVAGTANGPADQIVNAKTLLDSGAINQEEFDALKTKALA